MKEVINKIIERIDDSLKIEEDYVDFPKYEAVKIDKNNFHEISYSKTAKKICFVDGGNAEIIRASNFSLQFVRVYYNIFKDNKKIKSKRYEFFVLVNSVNKGEKIVYECDFFLLNDLNINKEDFSFDSFDKSLKQGEHRVSVSKIGEIARRFLELAVSNIALNELDKDDILVMDRDLEIDVTNEENFFNKLYENAVKKNIIVNGLSKTTNLLTKKGNSVNALLNILGLDKEWYYWLLKADFDIYFVKLHEKAKYCFRLDISKKVDYDINEVLSLLVENSKDPVFLGYPYGLIGADKFARVTNNERTYLRTLFITKFGKRWEKISKYETSLDAHEVLDRVC